MRRVAFGALSAALWIVTAFLVVPPLLLALLSVDGVMTWQTYVSFGLGLGTGLLAVRAWEET